VQLGRKRNTIPAVPARNITTEVEKHGSGQTAGTLRGDNTDEPVSSKISK